LCRPVLVLGGVKSWSVLACKREELEDGSYARGRSRLGVSR
jgi:hypothetical protein